MTTLSRTPGDPARAERFAASALRLRALVALEARGFGPLALVLLGAGLALVLVLRWVTGSERGELAAQVPFLGAALVTLLAALGAADLVARDAGSGFARTLGRLPARAFEVGVVRLAALALSTATLAVSLAWLEPPNVAVERARLAAPLLTAVVVPALVCVLLAAAATRHAIGGALLGLGGYAALVLGLARLSRCEHAESLTARIAGLGAARFVQDLSPWTVACGAALALVVGVPWRGPGARRPWRRVGRAGLGALALLAPALVATTRAVTPLVRVPFEDAAAQVAAVDLVAPETLLITLERGRSCSHEACAFRSHWAIDLATGSRRRVGSRAAEALRERARLGAATWLGTVADADGGRGRIALPDGSLRQSPRIAGLAAARSVHVSPDGRWAALQGAPPIAVTARPTEFPLVVQLVDLATGEVVAAATEATFLGWGADGSVLARQHARGPCAHFASGDYVRLRPSGAERLELPPRVRGIVPLDAAHILGFGEGTLELLDGDLRWVRRLRETSWAR